MNARFTELAAKQARSQEQGGQARARFEYHSDEDTEGGEGGTMVMTTDNDHGG